MIDVLVLAVASAISPAILAVVIVALNAPRPRRLLAAYLAGGLLGTIALGFAIVRSVRSIGVLDGPNPVADPIVDFVVAAIALGIAALLLGDRELRLVRRARERRAARPHRDPWSQRVLERANAPTAFLVGIALNMPGALYLVALKDIAQHRSSVAGQLIPIVLFCVIMFAFAEIPLIGAFFAPAATDARVRAVDRWLSGHARAVIGAVALVVAMFLTIRGLVALD